MSDLSDDGMINAMRNPEWKYVEWLEQQIPQSDNRILEIAKTFMTGFNYVKFLEEVNGKK